MQLKPKWIHQHQQLQQWDNMKNKTTLILIAIIMLMTIALTYMFMSRNDQGVMIQDKQLQQRVDSLTVEIEKVQNERILLDNNIINLNDSLHVLQNDILAKETKIKKLKSEYAKKINYINNFTSNDVTEYFTNRYE